MSIETVEQVLWDVNFRPGLLAEFQQSPEALLARYPLAPDEIQLIRTMDVRTLADRGASQMLVMMVYQSLHGGMAAMPDYLLRMNRGRPQTPGAASQ